MSRGRNTENPASGEDSMFRLTMACILVATAVFGLIQTAISHDGRSLAETKPITQVVIPGY